MSQIRNKVRGQRPDFCNDKKSVATRIKWYRNKLPKFTHLNVQLYCQLALNFLGEYQEGINIIMHTAKK